MNRTNLHTINQYVGEKVTLGWSYGGML
jgi:hypothetical protein